MRSQERERGKKNRQPSPWGEGVALPAFSSVRQLTDATGEGYLPSSASRGKSALRIDLSYLPMEILYHHDVACIYVHLAEEN